MTISTSVHIEGLKEVQRKFDGISRELRGPAMEGAMRKATMIVTASAKKNAPVDTGRLRASITPDVRNTWGSTVEGIVGSNVKYAPFQELGTKRMKGRFYLRKAVEENIKRIVECFVEKVAELCRR